MNVELVAEMFKNYQSSVLFHLTGSVIVFPFNVSMLMYLLETGGLKDPA